MKPSEIIYWNQFTGLTESFNKTDMRFAKDVSVYGIEKHTDVVIQHFLNEGEVFFQKRFEVRTPTPFAPKFREGKIKCKLALKLKEKTDTYIDTCLTEIRDDYGDELIVGWIKLVNNITEPINSVKGKSAVIVHDVSPQAMFCSTEASNALGALAMALGAYLFGIVDGDWQRVGKSYRDIIHNPVDENKALKAKIENIKNDFFNERTQYETRIAKYQSQINSLRSQLKENTRTIEKQKSRIIELEKIAKKYSHKQKIAAIKTEKHDYAGELQIRLSNKKVCFVGGVESWEQKIKQIIPSAAFIYAVNFDADIIRNSDTLVINTNFIGHDTTKKAVGIANSSKIKIIYTSKSNLDSMCKDILRNM